MVTHDLKTAAVYWDAVASGEKTFEVRRDDRGLQKGDRVLLRKHDGNAFVTATGASDHASNALTIKASVAWVMTGGQLGIEPGYVVLALADVHPQPL